MTDLRSKPATFRQRRHSSSEFSFVSAQVETIKVEVTKCMPTQELSDDFLERALRNARQSLEGYVILTQVRKHRF